MGVPAEAIQAQVPAGTRGDSDRPLARAATWFVVLVAVALMATSVGCYVYHRWQLAAIATEHLRLIVTGPATLRHGAANEYTVSTTAISGRPMSIQVEAALSTPDGTRLTAYRETTDEHGRLQVAIPPDLAIPSRATLKVTAFHRDTEEEAEIPLTVEPVRYATCLSTDKPLYRPGETVYFRSLTLPSPAATANPKFPVQFSILDPGGAMVPQSLQECITQQAVGAGEFLIPESLAAGQYTLLVRSPEQMFSEQKQSFYVRGYQLPRWKKELVFAADGYAPGEKVTATFRAQRLDGQMPAGVKLHLVATVDGQQIYEKDASFDQPPTADEPGTLQILFDLPQTIERGEGQLAVTVADGDAMESETKAIPMVRGAIDVAFFPEGGKWVAGLETRVYFAARDALGRPVTLSGVLLAEMERKGNAEEKEPGMRQVEVAALETVYNGMGTFAIIPREDVSYRLKLTRPAGMKCDAKLPTISAQGKIVLSAGAGVSAAGKPLEFNVRAAQPGLPLVAAVYRGGVQVGQQPLVTKVGPTGANPVAIALADTVSGVLRLAVFDYSVSPPQLLAERLVYRRPMHRLNVQVVEQGEPHAPGTPVDLKLLVTNEKKEPVPAVLGVSVVDEALLSLDDRRMPSMPACFFMTGAVTSLEDLENVADRLSEETKADSPAAVALDLLLGTQGMQRPAEKAIPDVAEKEAKSDRLAVSNESDVVKPPLMFDNVNKIRENYDQSLAEYRDERTKSLGMLITLAFFAGLGLMLLVAMLGLMRITWGMHLWVLSVLAAACSLAIGVMLDPSRQPPGLDSAVAFQSYFAATSEGPQKPKPPAAAQSETTPAQATPPDAAHASEKTTLESPQHPYSYRHSTVPAGANNDHAETLYWNPTITADADGKATIRFDLSDAATTFRVRIDAQGDGRIGAGQSPLRSYKPIETTSPTPPSEGSAVKATSDQ